MDQAILLSYLLDVVERQKLLYAIAGSHASMAFGESRLTNDIDVVIGLSPATLAPFCAAFPFPEFYVSEDGGARRPQRVGCSTSSTPRAD